VPVIGHLEGRVPRVRRPRRESRDGAAIVLNAKMRRTGVCGAAETLLVDRGCAATHLGPLVKALLEAGCEVRGDEPARATMRA
jgi:glutamate-5-semialdehyde dehydrogenase